MTRHFLRDDDLSPTELLEVLDLADAMKAAPFDHKPLVGPQTVALVFDRPTLRTQVSFAAGIAELGGNPMTVDGGLAAMGSREGVEDVARVLGRQAAAVVWRTAHQSDVVTMAEHAGVPVLNALTDEFHPCQLLADLQTVREQQGPAGRRPRRVRRRRRVQHGQLVGPRRRLGGPARRHRCPRRLHPRRRRGRHRARDRPGHGRLDRADQRPGRGRRPVPTWSSPTPG